MATKRTQPMHKQSDDTTQQDQTQTPKTEQMTDEERREQDRKATTIDPSQKQQIGG